MAQSQPKYEVNRAMSKRRAERLQSYLTKQVWDPSTRKAWPDFICACKEACKASAAKRSASFHAAQGHAVGDCYDLRTADDVPFRVLIVPMEAGGGETYFSVEGRTEKVRESGRLRFQKRNAHMKGVTLALRLALGLPYQDRNGAPLLDHDSERVTFADGKGAHLFDCFAMANLLLCSAVLKRGSQKSLAPQVMRDNCVHHLVKTIGILKPTLVISQGWGLVPPCGRTSAMYVPSNTRSTAASSRIATWTVTVSSGWGCGTRHDSGAPSISGISRNTVVPAITAGRKRALKLAQPV